MAPWSLDGRVAVVTGGAGRLGPVFAQGLAEAGALVAAIVLPGTEDDPRLRRVVDLHPGAIHIESADVLDRAALVRARVSIAEKLGPPRVLVNSAGIDAPPTHGKGYALDEMPIDEFRRVLDVNIAGAFQSTQVFGSAMARADGGSIVNIGSLYASVSPDARLYDHLEMTPPFLKPPAYGASKAALVNLTKYFATHWASFGVRVNALSPGGVSGGQDPIFTEKFRARVPLGRLAQEEELKAPLVFLASDASSYVTGTELRVDGGFTAW